MVQYQANSENFSVEGYKLEQGDIRVKYTLAATGLNKCMAEKYEADSQDGILVLLNVCADASMKDEGTAREIINRVQKLRKEAKLVPSDLIQVYYKLDTVKEKTVDLERVCREFNEYIQNSLKASFVELSGDNSNSFLIQSSSDIKGESIEIFIELANSTCNGTPTNACSVPYQNVERKLPSNQILKSTVLLENPLGQSLSTKLDKSWSLSVEQNSPFCKYLNVHTVPTGSGGGDVVSLKATVLLENVSTVEPYDSKSISNWNELLKNVSKINLQNYFKDLKSN